MPTNPKSHIPLTHLYITNAEPPMLKHDLVVYLDANEKITLQPDPPKTYIDKTYIIYKVETATNTPAGYYHPDQIVIACIGKPHIVETTIIDGVSRNTVINSSDRAEPE
jgi:hypothetical protein